MQRTKTNGVKKFLAFLLLTPFLTGCLFQSSQQNDIGLNGTWQLYDAEPIAGESGKHSFSEQAGLKRLVKEGNVLCLFEDGTYAELKGENEYHTGRFENDNGKNALRFIPTGEPARSFDKTTEEMDKSNKPTLSLQNKEQGLQLKYLKTANTPADFRDAPFYPGNNLWRVKPEKQEDYTQKIARLTNYIKHVALVLKTAKEEKQAVVSFAFSGGPVKIYNGGIGIHPFAIVPQSWKDCFYNEADAFSAYNIYQSYLQKSSYNGAGTGNWVEDDYTILLSIYADLHEQETGNKR